MIAAEVASQQGPAGLADREITALTAYLQRLGTDIKWKKPAPATLTIPAGAARPAFAPGGPDAPARPAFAPGGPDAPAR